MSGTMPPSCYGRVQLVGRAQTVYGRLPKAAKENYAALKKALKERFEPESRGELYLSKFSTRKRRPGEYADELWVLADEAFPELEEQARESLALNQYLGQLDNPQVAFNVKQKRLIVQGVQPL